MSNQTIDGVPRESLELALGFLDGYGHEDYQRVIADELRALLKAADHAHEWDINSEGTATVCNCGARSSDEPSV